MPYASFLFQYQAHTEPVLATAERVSEDKWHQPWSEPVRQKISPLLAVALIASGLSFLELQAGELIQSSKWYAPFSEPVRFKQGLAPHLQQSFTSDTIPILTGRLLPWFAALSEPKRFPSAIITAATPSFFYGSILAVVPFGYFEPLTEPVRIKPRLMAGLNDFLERISFIPINYTASMNAIEPGDIFLAVLRQYNRARRALVSIFKKR